MSIIDPKSVVLIFDDMNKQTSTVVCEIPAGISPKGEPLFRKQLHTVTRKEADQIALILLRRDKQAADLRDGKKPGKRIRIEQG